MPDVVVREFQEADEAGYEAVLSLTYNNGLPISPERKDSKFIQRFVAECEGKVLGIFSILDFNLTRGSSLLRCAAVAAVGVAPDSRRSGIGNLMMDWSIRHFKEKGFPLASLYAFREPFYGKSGYTVCGKRIRLSVPMHRLPKLPSTLPVRRLSPSDWRLLVDCHKASAHSRSGVNVRTELMWERVLAEDKPLAIYAAGEPVEGFVVVSHSVAFWQPQSLSEVTWSTKAGYEACLAIMHQVGINKTSMEWFEPSDSPYYAQYLDQGVTAEIQRPAMFRACDVGACLRALRPGGEGTFTLKVLDSQVEENEGPWAVTFAGGSVQAERTQTDRPDIEMGIKPFVQAFLGDPSFAELAAFGSIQVNNLKARIAAETLLPHHPVYISEFF